MNASLKPLFVFVIVATTAVASPTLDKLYRLKKVAPYVLNLQANPVFARHLEKTLFSLIDNGRQFDMSPEGYQFLADADSPLETTSLKELKSNKLEALSSLIPKLNDLGIDALLLGEIEAATDSSKSLNLLLISTRTSEIISEVNVRIENNIMLESYESATKQAFDTVARSIPFETEILSREGYRVVIGRGGPQLAVGQALPTYTIEQVGPNLFLQESGIIVLTEVGEDISFGQITVERKPFEVTKLNKIHIPGVPKAPSGLFLPQITDGARDMASLPAARQASAQYGYVSIAAGAHLVNVANSPAASSGSVSNNNMYPGAKLEAQLWMSRTLFVELGLQVAMSTIGIDSQNISGLNSSLNNGRIQFAYQLPLNRTSLAPVLFLKTGYSRQQFQFDANPAPLSFVTSTYSGLMTGAAVSFPLDSSYGVDFDIGALLLGAIKESPLTSGAKTTSVNAWQFSLGGYYRFTQNISLTGKLFFQSNRAEFEGDGTRPVPIASVNHSIRSFLAGLQYAF